MKKYVRILKQLNNEEIEDELIDELEEELETLYYDLSEEEIAIIETEDLSEIDIEEEDE
jgi:hypothetical protein